MWWSKVKLWCYHNWRILVVVITILIAFLLGRGKLASARAQLSSMRELYKKEKEALKTLDKEKEKKKEAARIKYNKAILMATKQMHESRDELQKKKAERVREILIQSKDDPDAVDDILFKEFGIKNK